MTTTTAWPTAVPTHDGRRRLLALTSLTEFRAGLRAPEFLVGAIAIPVLLYAMFGLPNASSTLPAGTTIATAMMVSLTCYGVISLAIFTFGDEVAKERGRGWIRTLHATGFPAALHPLGKSVAALAYALMVVLAIGTLAATAGGVRLSPAQWAWFSLLGVAGIVVFAPLGFAIAYLVRPRTAAMIANVVFLPLSFASGFFVPMSQLPEAVARLAQVLPTYHYGQLMYRTVMPTADVEAFTGAVLAPVWVNLAWVVAGSVAFAALTLWAVRREAVTRRG